MRKFFTLVAVLMLVLTSGGLLLTACGKEKQVAIKIDGSLPDGIASYSTNASYDSSPVATKTYREIFFTKDEGCTGWGTLSLTVTGIKSDKTEEIILEDGTQTSGAIKSASAEQFCYELPSNAIDAYDEIKLAFSGEAEFEMVSVKLQVQEGAYTTLSTDNLRFNVKSNGKFVEIAKEPVAEEEPEMTTELNFEQLQTLFGDNGFNTPKNRDFEIVVWETGTENSLKAIEINEQNSTSQHFYRYENDVVKTTLLIDKISDNIRIELPDASKAWFDTTTSGIELSLVEGSNTFLLGRGTNSGVSQTVFAGEQEIKSFSDLKDHINDSLTIKFESTKAYSILDYLASQQANFQFLGQKNLKLTKEESETDGKVVYSVGNITNPFQTGDNFVFLVTPVFSEIANLDGLMVEPGVVNSVGNNVSQDSLYDGDAANEIAVNDGNVIKNYVWKDGSFEYSCFVNDVNDQSFRIDDVKSKTLTVTYAKGKTITITLTDNLNGEQTNAADGVTLSSKYEDNGSPEVEAGEVWTITLHFDKISICDLETITIELK